jgi:hypothetical protein
MKIIEEKVLELCQAIQANSLQRKQDIIELVAELNKLFGLSGSAGLQQFGSSAYGLCSGTSDLDLALPPAAMALLGEQYQIHVNALTNGCGIDELACLRAVHETLQQNDDCFTNLELRESARVPIVAFTDRSRCIDIDISAQNGLALFNTKLLKAYVDWDERVGPLMMLVVRWAKSHKICGSTNCGFTSFLSSYSWKLLVVYYLQHTATPILPNLQQPDASSPVFKAEVITEHGTVPISFYDGPNNTPADAPKNTASVGSLFVQFFAFFTSDRYGLTHHAVDIANEAFSTASVSVCSVPRSSRPRGHPGAPPCTSMERRRRRDTAAVLIILDPFQRTNKNASDRKHVIRPMRRNLGLVIRHKPNVQRTVGALSRTFHLYTAARAAAEWSQAYEEAEAEKRAAMEKEGPLRGAMRMAVEGAEKAAEKEVAGVKQEVKKEVVGVKQEAEKEVAGVKQEVEKEVGGVKQDVEKEVVGVKQEVKKEVVGVKQEVEKEVAGVKQEAEKEVAGVKQEVEKEVVGVKQEAEKEVVGVKQEVEKEVVGVKQEAEKEVVGVKQEAEKEVVGVKQEVEKEVAGVMQSVIGQVVVNRAEESLRLLIQDLTSLELAEETAASSTTVRVGVMQVQSCYCYCILHTALTHCYCILHALTHCYCILHALTHCYYIIHSRYCILHTARTHCYYMLHSRYCSP